VVHHGRVFLSLKLSLAAANARDALHVVSVTVHRVMIYARVLGCRSSGSTEISHGVVDSLYAEHIKCSVTASPRRLYEGGSVLLQNIILLIFRI